MKACVISVHGDSGGINNFWKVVNVNVNSGPK